MGFMDKIKKQLTVADEYDDSSYDDDGYYNDITDGYASDPEPMQPQQPMQPQNQQYGNYSAGSQYNTSYQQPAQSAPSSFGGISIGGNALQMKVIRPDSFACVSQIADHLLSQRTVVLNLEATNKETARRLIDFLSGVAYSIDGSLKRIANNAYIITPSNVDVSGEQLREQRKSQPTPQPVQSEDEDDSYNY